MRRGAGGVTRNSHQMIGSAANATSSHGETKAREPSANIGQRSAEAVLPSPTQPWRAGSLLSRGAGEEL